MPQRPHPFPRRYGSQIRLTFPPPDVSYEVYTKTLDLSTFFPYRHAKGADRVPSHGAAGPPPISDSRFSFDGSLWLKIRRRRRRRRYFVYVYVDVYVRARTGAYGPVRARTGL